MKIRKLRIVLILSFSQWLCAIELEPYETPKISEEQWNAYYAKVSAELASSRSTFKYEAGELENFSDPKTYTNISFTTPGHDAHPSWVASQLVVDGNTLTAKVIGYHAGSETAYLKFYGLMNDMMKRTLDASREQ